MVNKEINGQKLKLVTTSFTNVPRIKTESQKLPTETGTKGNLTQTQKTLGRSVRW